MGVINLLEFSTWYDACVKVAGADGADLSNHTRQNTARQYAASFCKRDTNEPLDRHLIRDTESVLVTTTVDLVPPRGDGVDHLDDNVKLEFEQRAFFADQFEVRIFFSPTTRFSVPPFMHRPGLVGLLLISFTSYGLRVGTCP